MRIFFNTYYYFTYFFYPIANVIFVVRIDGNPATVDAEEAFDEGYVAPAAQAAAAAKPAAATKASPATKPSPAAKPGIPAETPAKKPLAADPDDSSVADFDFLDEDDDLKKQPKL